MSEPDPARPVAARVRRVLLRVALLLAGVELASFAVSAVLEGRLPSPARAAAERRALLAGADDAGPPAAGAAAEDEPGSDELVLRLRNQVLHPYVGFVFDRKLNEEQTPAQMGGRTVTEYGFLGAPGLFVEPAPERVVIGITGGSLALFFTIQGLDALTDELTRSPEFQGKEIAYVTLALTGMKQPQQLFALTYALSLGARFDYVVNLDGFNEVTLPVIENEPKRVAPFYPRSWYWRVSDVQDPELRRAAGELVYLEALRGDWAAAMSRGPLTWSATWNLAWRLRDRSLERGAARVEARLLAHAPGEERFVAQGPYRPPVSEEALYDELVGIWSRASLQMHRLCTANGIRYVHLLQPNQYVPGSKPMGREERARAISEASPFRGPVERGYPRLSAAGAELVGEGIRFEDLTRAFEGVEAPLYDDACCHLNRAGYRLLAGRIASAILAGS